MIATVTTPPAHRFVIARAARLFGTAWVTVVAAGTLLQWIHVPFAPTTPLVLVALLGLLFCARPVRLGATLELSAAHPITFAALLTWGTSSALVVAACCALGAVLLRPRGLGFFRGTFNVAVGLGAVLGAGSVLTLAGAGGGADLATPSTMTALFLATAVSFPLSTLPVAIAVGCNSGQSIWRLWATRYLPTAPGFLGASGLALGLVVAAQQFGVGSLLFYIPLATALFTRSIRLPPAGGPQAGAGRGSATQATR